MENKNIFSRSSHTDNKGITLFFIIFIVLLIGTLLTVGMSVIGPMVKRAKYNETGATIDGAVKAIASWSAANNRLPDNTVFPFSTIVSNPLDAWSKPLIYVYDGTMTSAATGGICGRNTTGILQGTTYVAFVIISGGDDLTVQSIPGVSGAYAGNLNNLSGNDYFRVVTLDEMKQLAGCYGATRGKLAILNNELPTGCPSQPYAATVFPEGGVPPYQWSIQGTLPPGIIANPGSVYPSWSGNSPSVGFSGTAPAMVTTYPFIVKVRDSDNNNAERNFKLKIKACGTFSNWNVINKAGSPSSIVVNPNNTVTFGGNTINTAGCIWYPYSAQLSGKTMRVVFNFRFQDIDSGTSINFGNGFTFAFIQGNSNTTTICGNLAPNGAQLGALMGYGGMLNSSFAVEFDTYPDGSQNDPAGNWNHVAIDKNGSVQHGTGGNPFCDGTDRGCIYNGFFGNTYPVTWLENDQNGDGQTETHSARIEVFSQCDSSCGACGVTGNSYANIKVWIDCSNCSDLNNNYSATPPQVTHCFLLDAALSDVKVGFTEATGTRSQSVTVSNFGIGSN